MVPTALSLRRRLAPSTNRSIVFARWRLYNIFTVSLVHVSVSAKWRRSVQPCSAVEGSLAYKPTAIQVNVAIARIWYCLQGAGGADKNWELKLKISVKRTFKKFVNCTA